jgi:Uncharacterized protein conserved in bacteria
MLINKADKYRLFNGLEELARLQQPILETLGYYDTSTETLSRYGLALTVEVGEFLNEVPWKAWKKRPGIPPDLDRIKKEFADLMCFIGAWINYLELLGISTSELSVAIQEMLEANYIRFGVDVEDKNGQTDR